MKKSIIIISLAAAFLLSCKEFKDIGPHGSTATPGKVTVTEVVNNYGKSIIYYNLPDDSNLHYIKAIYSPRPGETAEVNASFMTDSLIVDGFKEAKDYTVELVSVSYGNTWSEPVNVTVSPLTPPYQLCVEEMSITECFGGLTVATENPTKANLDFIVYKMEEDGTWKEVDTRYLSDPEIRFAVRGQDAVPSTFKVTVRDRWGNSCESLEQNLTPWFETELDKSKIKAMTLAGDAVIHPNLTKGVPGCFDGLLPGNFDEDYTGGCYHTVVGTPMPSVFSFDMGQKCRFSRMIWYPRHIFKAGHPRIMELYGATSLNPDATRELYDADGVLDPYWTLLATFESKRPSGETVNSLVSPLTDEERQLMFIGEEFEFPDGAEASRYVRVRTIETWGKQSYVECNEITLFGIYE